MASRGFPRLSVASRGFPWLSEGGIRQVRRKGRVPAAGHFRPGVRTAGTGVKGHPKPVRVKSSQVESSQVKSSRVESSQVKSSQVKSSQVKSSQVKFCTFFPQREWGGARPFRAGVPRAPPGRSSSLETDEDRRSVTHRSRRRTRSHSETISVSLGDQIGISRGRARSRYGIGLSRGQYRSQSGTISV